MLRCRRGGPDHADPLEGAATRLFAGEVGVRVSQAMKQNVPVEMATAVARARDMISSLSVLTRVIRLRIRPASILGAKPRSRK